MNLNTISLRALVGKANNKQMLNVYNGSSAHLQTEF